MRLGSAALSVALVCASAGCERTLASDSAPDFAGVWDVTYDDSIQVELRQGNQSLRAEVGDQGGAVSFGGDAGEGLALDVDCADEQVLCPSEVWPHELHLETAPGRLVDDGAQLVRSLSAGKGACALKPGSVLTGEVLTTASELSMRPEALALTSGRIHVRFDAACFASGRALASAAEVILSVGYTAAKR
jgi:hypothetical protein